MPVSREAPPHGLQLVVDYVNTLDLDEETDALTDAAALGRWVFEQRLLDPSARPSAADHASALALREALRAVMGAHAEGETPPADALAVLDEVAGRGRLSVRFDAAPGDRITVAAREPGIAGALAGILAPVAPAAMDGSWLRAKVCVCDDCRWAFYDRSRNRSGRWCDMAVCGNRTKVNAYRRRTTG